MENIAADHPCTDGKGHKIQHTSKCQLKERALNDCITKPGWWSAL